MDKKIWFLETRPQFLLLSVLLVAHGSALAYWQQEATFNWVYSVLAMVGLVLLHASANVLNDWHDYSKTGIDRQVQQTPFSGGSGLLPKQIMQPKQALLLGIVTLVIGAGIGFYLVWQTGWELLVIGLVGAFSVVAYTPLLTKIGLGEIFAGLGLGLLPVVGVYFIQTGTLEPIAWVSGLPAFFLTYNLLLLNEFPDTDADRAGGRKHMVVLLGKKNAAYLYAAVELAAFVVIVVAVITGYFTPWALLGLIALVAAMKAITTAFKQYDSFEGLIPAQGANVMAVLGMNLLLAVGYLIAGLAA